MSEAQIEFLTTSVGESFAIRLRLDPAAGTDGWQAIYDANAVAFLDRSFVPDPAGAGGEEVLTFRAIRAGTAEITFALRGSHEKGGEGSRVFRIDVQGQ